MKTYQWILFDADETLFHFDDLKGLQRMFARFGVMFTEADYKAYQAVNKPLWVEYQNGSITAEQLQHKRFDHWASKLVVSPHDLNSAFLTAMAEICQPKDGAVNLVKALKGKSKLGIVTNGFTELQQVRLERTGLRDHFDVLVISEQIGIAKPHPGIFEHAFSIMGNPERDQILMVGDNPDSDILGGINVGIDTCWVNAHKKPVPKDIVPNYHVSNLMELESLLLGK